MKTAYLIEKIEKHVTGVATYTKPTNTYIGLLTDDPTLSGTQTSEVTGGSYARQQVAWIYSSTANNMSNSALITFTNLPATTIRYWAIFDGSTSGNMLFYEAFDTNVIVPSGLEFNISIGNLIYKDS